MYGIFLVPGLSAGIFRVSGIFLFGCPEFFLGGRKCFLGGQNFLDVRNFFWGGRNFWGGVRLHVQLGLERASKVRGGKGLKGDSGLRFTRLS